jgi:hypothetical protein
MWPGYSKARSLRQLKYRSTANESLQNTTANEYLEKIGEPYPHIQWIYPADRNKPHVLVMPNTVLGLCTVCKQELSREELKWVDSTHPFMGNRMESDTKALCYKSNESFKITRYDKVEELNEQSHIIVKGQNASASELAYLKHLQPAENTDGVTYKAETLTKVQPIDA